jgi:hypothetical protein
MRVGPALRGEGPMPAQHRCLLYEEAAETDSSRASPASTARSAGSSADRWTGRRRTAPSSLPMAVRKRPITHHVVVLERLDISTENLEVEFTSPCRRSVRRGVQRTPSPRRTRRGLQTGSHNPSKRGTAHRGTASRPARGSVTRSSSGTCAQCSLARPWRRIVNRRRAVRRSRRRGVSRRPATS